MWTVRTADTSVVSSLVSQEEEREMKYRRYYQRVLKDRLTALRKVRYAVFDRAAIVGWGTR